MGPTAAAAVPARATEKQGVPGAEAAAPPRARRCRRFRLHAIFGLEDFARRNQVSSLRCRETAFRRSSRRSMSAEIPRHRDE